MPYVLVGPKSIAFLRRSKNCQEYVPNDLVLDECSKTEFVLTIERLRSTNAKVFVIPVDDSANRIVYSISHCLGASTYPIPDSASFEMLNDKRQFHRLCSTLGVRVPKSVYLRDKAEIDFGSFRAMLGLPFVVKPTNKSNSLGFQVIRSREDLHKHVLSPRKYDFSPLLAQSFIPGVDVDLSALIDRGRIRKFAIQTRKRDALCFVRNEELVMFTEIIARKLCYTGVIHLDARLHSASGEIFMIEANPRFWGSLAEATSAGLNFVRAGIYASMGLEGPDPTTISDIRVPSIPRMLTEMLTFKRSYSRLNTLERLRLQRWMGSRFRAALRFDL
ncbi:hypothetical protein XH80_25105 [Bradyrhizobium sp. CCBAU 45384]|nr:hypothetical protein [Bradyrhizobium sp. CCBAU 45384]